MRFFFIFLFIATTRVFSFNIQVVNFIDKDSPVYIVVFDQEEGFPYEDDKAIFKWTGLPSVAEDKVGTGLPAGNYAVAVFQDTSGDGKLNKWFFGKPREPYGISGTLEKPLKKLDFNRAVQKVFPDTLMKIRLWRP